MLTLEIILIAILTAGSCVIPGTFLILNRKILISDGIGHSLLLGIVVFYLWIEDLKSPWLFLGGSLSVLMMIICSEYLQSRFKIYRDASLALTFPTFFAIAIILIYLFANKVHLDEDMVILGEIAFAPFHRLEIQGMDLGPKALWMMGSIFLSNLILTKMFYKELILATFDEQFSQQVNINPKKINYLIILMATYTAVGAFEEVGTILVMALMTLPASISFLWTYQVNRMIIVAFLICIIASIAGYKIAAMLDTSITGSMILVLGAGFLISVFFTPKKKE